MSSTIIMPNGRDAPSLGLGTWHMGERTGDPAAEALALKRGLDLGATFDRYSGNVRPWRSRKSCCRSY